MPTLAERLVPDTLWYRVAPLLPPPPPRSHGGRRRTIPDRACFAAVVFMARTSTSRELLPASRPAKVRADKGYDDPRCRAYLHRRRIGVRIARRGIDTSIRLGRYRWKAERTIASGCLVWLPASADPLYERYDERFYAFVLLASALICFRALTSHPGEL